MAQALSWSEFAQRCKACCIDVDKQESAWLQYLEDQVYTDTGLDELLSFYVTAKDVSQACERSAACSDHRRAFLKTCRRHCVFDAI